ncbi:MAG: hypothetical protein F6K10_21030 [Moorea sp. SIO2B7]|nr:hypothetical protein [Moorena sp. SIO2B7]
MRHKIKFFTLVFTSVLLTEVANATSISQGKNRVSTQDNQRISGELSQIKNNEPYFSSHSYFMAQNESSNLDTVALATAVLEEMNQARTNTQTYLNRLEKMKRYYDGNLLKLPGKPAIETKEGVVAVEEAIRFLRYAKTLSLSPLSSSRELSMKARTQLPPKLGKQRGIYQNQTI